MLRGENEVRRNKQRNIVHNWEPVSEIEPPCKACIEGKDTISITGTTNTGRKTTIHIENKGDGIFYVEDEVAEEVNEIRCGRCVYEYKLR